MDQMEKNKTASREKRWHKQLALSTLIFTISVAFLAAGISLSGMAVVISEKWLWVVGMLVGAVGVIGILWVITTMLN